MTKKTFCTPLLRTPSHRRPRRAALHAYVLGQRRPDADGLNPAVVHLQLHLPYPASESHESYRLRLDEHDLDRTLGRRSNLNHPATMDLDSCTSLSTSAERPSSPRVRKKPMNALIDTRCKLILNASYKQV
jgi:hypothetical protein